MATAVRFFVCEYPLGARKASSYADEFLSLESEWQLEELGYASVIRERDPTAPRLADAYYTDVDLVFVDPSVCKTDEAAESAATSAVTRPLTVLIFPPGRGPEKTPSRRTTAHRVWILESIPYTVSVLISQNVLPDLKLLASTRAAKISSTAGMPRSPQVAAEARAAIPVSHLPFQTMSLRLQHGVLVPLEKVVGHSIWKYRPGYELRQFGARLVLYVLYAWQSEDLKYHVDVTAIAESATRSMQAQLRDLDIGLRRLHDTGNLLTVYVMAAEDKYASDKQWSRREIILAAAGLLGFNSAGSTSDDSLIWYFNMTEAVIFDDLSTAMGHFALTSDATGYHCFLRLLYSRLLDEAIQNDARVPQYPFRLRITSADGEKLAIDADGSDFLLVRGGSKQPVAWREVCKRLFEPDSHRELLCVVHHRGVQKQIAFEYLDPRTAGGCPLEFLSTQKVRTPSAPAEDIAGFRQLLLQTRSALGTGKAPAVAVVSETLPSHVAAMSQLEELADLPSSSRQARTIALEVPAQVSIRVDMPKYVYFGPKLYVTFTPEPEGRFELNELVMSTTHRDLGLRASDFLSTFSMLAYLFDQSIHLKDGSTYCWADQTGRIRQCKTGLIAWLSTGSDYSFYTKYGYSCEKPTPNLVNYWQGLRQVPPRAFEVNLQLAVPVNILSRPQQFWLYEARQLMAQISQPLEDQGGNILNCFTFCLKTIGAADMPTMDAKPGTLLDALHYVVTSPQPYQLSLQDIENQLRVRPRAKRAGMDAGDERMFQDEGTTKRPKLE